MKLLWSEQITRTSLLLEQRSYAITIRTAQTQAVKNAMAGLAVRQPVIAAGVNESAIRHITETQQRMMNRTDVMFNVPEMIALSYQTPVGVYDFVFVWGLLLLGSGREKTPTAEQRLVLCMEHELGEVLNFVFELERVLDIGHTEAAPNKTGRRTA